MKDPIVIDPPGFDVKAAWKGCQDEVDRCGGLATPDGEVNWRAAFSADPGCCSCPACGEYFWAWGNRQKCSTCGFEYETNWWPNYSDGCNVGLRFAGKRNCPDPETNRGMLEFYGRSHDRKMQSPYYRYGFEHPVEDAWVESHRINWRAVLSELSLFPSPPEPPTNGPKV